MGRFEDYPPRRSVELIASFNAWHWIEPAVAVDRAAQLIKPGGYVALIWTEVLSSKSNHSKNALLRCSALRGKSALIM